MISIIDYGVGNLFSLCSSLKAINADAVVTSEPSIIKRSEKIILPGVGAFADAKGKLVSTGLDNIIREEADKGKKIFGICLGMQMLFEKSFEYGEHEGLGFLRGEIVGMEGRLPPELKIPHIGWNYLKFNRIHPLFKYTKEGDYVYFVHSYYAQSCEESLIASTEYGRSITAAVAYDNIAGTQFHPEKSGNVGLGILKAFCEW